MAVLSATNTIDLKAPTGENGRITAAMKVYATADTFYPGALLGLIRSTGLVEPLAATTNYPSAVFAGFCTAGLTTAASSSDRVSANISGGMITCTVTGATAQTDFGAEVFCGSDNANDSTLTGTATNFPIGTVVRYISGTTCEVLLYSLGETLRNMNPRPFGNRIGALAATGSAQGNAASIVNTITHVTAADDTTGVILPPVTPGIVRIVYNAHATAGLKVYPALGDQVGETTANSAIVIEGSRAAVFVGYDATQWHPMYIVNA